MKTEDQVRIMGHLKSDDVPQNTIQMRNNNNVLISKFLHRDRKRNKTPILVRLRIDTLCFDCLNAFWGWSDNKFSSRGTKTNGKHFDFIVSAKFNIVIGLCFHNRWQISKCKGEIESIMVAKTEEKRAAPVERLTHKKQPNKHFQSIVYYEIFVWIMSNSAQCSTILLPPRNIHPFK